MVEEVRFDVTFSKEDVSKVMKALMKRFKAGKDEPIKTVGLALVVAELEVLMFRDLMSPFCTNLDDVLKELRLQCSERASYLYKR